MFPSGMPLLRDQRLARNAPNLMVHQTLVLVSAFGVDCRTDFLHQREAFVEGADASKWLVARLATRCGLHPGPVHPDEDIDHLILHSGMYIECLAHSGETAGCESTGDVASLARREVKKGTLEVVGAAVEALVASVDDCEHHSATGVAGHRLRVLVTVTMGLAFRFVGQ